MMRELWRRHWPEDPTMLIAVSMLFVPMIGFVIIVKVF